MCTCVCLVGGSGEELQGPECKIQGWAVAHGGPGCTQEDPLPETRGLRWCGCAVGERGDGHSLMAVSAAARVRSRVRPQARGGGPCDSAVRHPPTRTQGAEWLLGSRLWPLCMSGRPVVTGHLASSYSGDGLHELWRTYPFKKVTRAPHSVTAAPGTAGAAASTADTSQPGDRSRIPCAPASLA